MPLFSGTETFRPGESYNLKIVCLTLDNSDIVAIDGSASEAGSEKRHLHTILSGNGI